MAKRKNTPPPDPPDSPNRPLSPEEWDRRRADWVATACSSEQSLRVLDVVLGVGTKRLTVEQAQAELDKIFGRPHD